MTRKQIEKAIDKLSNRNLSESETRLVHYLISNIDEVEDAFKGEK